MARLDKEKQAEFEPKRMQYAKKQIESLDYTIIFESKTEIRFMFKGKEVRLFPYSGWHSGKSITDGRGLDKLIKQIL